MIKTMVPCRPVVRICVGVALDSALDAIEVDAQIAATERDVTEFKHVGT